MKKVFGLVVAIALFFLMAGCGEKPADSSVQAATSSASQQEDWGIELQAQDVTPTGMTLVCVQSGGNAVGSLETGSPFALEQLADGKWVPVSTKPDLENWAWTMEGWIIRREDTTQWEVTWDYLYGELSPGTYRLSKTIMDFRGPGDYTEQTYYVEFAIVD